jgi:hypothetical protein
MESKKSELILRILCALGAFFVGVGTSIVVAVAWPFMLSYWVYSNMTDEEEDED